MEYSLLHVPSFETEANDDELKIGHFMGASGGKVMYLITSDEVCILPGTQEQKIKRSAHYLLICIG